ncbi:alpha/beta hydrolase [Halobacterium sp. KA-4]|uniref:alpha/beta fold hydrolase n=1 Tax=Halobacterium sp. KA-4 TaxID=2896367 RepID=UPI001E39CA40|nr:alpha/beta hydrolase [Halobacterium sp. KA-4]MCD2201694.1 alpha/beta hydrolase [Halobacterium sp. KA-4]
MQTHTVRGGDDVTLHVEETGPADGPAILFLHGYSQSRQSWRPQFESPLADDYRLIAPDNRGHGESEKPPGTEPYQDSALWAADVDAILTELDVENVVLVGWSYASLIALDYLAEYGTERVTGVNLVGSVSGMGTEAAAELLGPKYVELFPELTSRDAEVSVDALETFLRRSVHEPLPLDEHYFMLGFNVVVPPHVRDGMRSRTLSHRDTLRDLDVPVLVTHGAEDLVMVEETARVHADLVPDSRTSIYPDVGHMPFWEAPERYNRELRAFVEECR